MNETHALFMRSDLVPVLKDRRITWQTVDHDDGYLLVMFQLFETYYRLSRLTDNPRILVSIGPPSVDGRWLTRSTVMRYLSERIDSLLD